MAKLPNRKEVSHTLTLHETIRAMRLERKLSGVELCRLAGDLDPKVLTAVEKGRIRNPSLKTIASLARGLGVTPSEIFSRAEQGIQTFLHIGNQKGEFVIDYPKGSCKLISFTPMIRDFFCGKLILSGKKKLPEKLLEGQGPYYASVIIGQIEAKTSDKTISLKPGDSLFFRSNFIHSFYNPLSKDSVLLLMTAPSIL